MRYYLVLAFLLSGCLDLGDSRSSVEGEEEDTDTDGDNDDCKIEGEQIGQEGVVLLLGSKTVTFGNWVGKTGSPGEFVGFTVAVDGGGGTFSYVVKAGGELHPGTAATWMHPAGADGGPDAPGISNVDGCDDDGGGGDDGPGDDGPGDDGPGDDGPIL